MFTHATSHDEPRITTPGEAGWGSVASKCSEVVFNRKKLRFASLSFGKLLIGPGLASRITYYRKLAASPSQNHGTSTVTTFPYCM